MYRAVALAFTLLVYAPTAPAVAGADGETRSARVDVAGAENGVAWRGSCFSAAAHHKLATGQNFEGIAVGAAVAFRPDTGLPVDGWLRCYIRVNGSEVHTTPNSALPFPAYERMSYSADGTDKVELCAQVSLEPLPVCRDMPVSPVGSDADPVVCPVVTVVRGIPGVVYVEDHGDVSVLSDRVWNCPPY